MKNYKGFLIDLDGTMYRGSEKIASAVHFVNQLYEHHLPYMFVTNNSSQTPAQVADALMSLGVRVTADQVITSSLATAAYIKQKKANATVYMIGEEGLKIALQKNALTIQEEAPDFVVVGIDRAINYEKLTTACLAVRQGATFLATNADKAIPTERGLVPGNGAMVSVIATSTGQTPMFIGKPEAVIIDIALQRLQLPKEKVVMIGDNYDTDILAGMNAGIDTLLVHTGVTTPADLQAVDIQPTYTVDRLTEWGSLMTF